MSCADLTWFKILRGFVGSLLSCAVLLLRAFVCALLSARFCLARFCNGTVGNCLECLKSDLEFDMGGNRKPMQISQNRCDVSALPGSRHHPCQCVDDSLQLVEVGGRCAVQYWVAVVNSSYNH